MRFLIFLLLKLIVITSFSQSKPAFTQLKAAIKTLDKDADMRSATWSICVMDAESGELLVQHNIDKALSTASIMKVVSSSTALDLLGSAYQYQTHLVMAGKVVDSVLHGDLYIRGSGDPTLGSDRLRPEDDIPQLLNAWSHAVQQAGIKRIEGKVIGDASILPTQGTPPNWNWEDLGNYYGAGAVGLNFHENMYQLFLKPGNRSGDDVKIVRTYPPMPELIFVNELRTGSKSSGDQTYIYGAPYTNIRHLRGTAPALHPHFSVKGSAPDPAFLAAKMLWEKLMDCNIFVKGFSTIRINDEKKYSERKTIIHTHVSAPLKDIIKPLNHESINLYAEAVLRSIAVSQGAKPSTAGACDFLMEHWKKRIDIEGLKFTDGSGLSSNNVMNTLQMCQVLLVAHKASWSDDFYQSLPVVAKSGTLKRLLKGTAAAGRIHGKSGYISGVRSYTGYAKTLASQDLIFCMMSNQYACGAGQMRRHFEKLMLRMVEGK